MTSTSTLKLNAQIIPMGSYASNCIVITHPITKESILIDPGNDENHLSSFIKKNDLKVTLILHTHAHFDHIGASSSIKEQTKAPILLHALDVPLYASLQEQGVFFGQFLKGPSVIDKTFEEGDTLGFVLKESTDGYEGLKSFMKVIHTPGHTAGGCSFFIEAGILDDAPVLVSGDTLFYESIGRTDLPGGSFTQIISSIKEKLFSLPETTIVIPGHGPNTQIGHEKKNNPFID